MAHSKIVTPNPYRYISKLYDIFEFLSDGAPHTLKAITDHIYYHKSSHLRLFRRRTASALRTIRKSCGFYVEFKDGKYRLGITFIEEAAVGSHHVASL